MIPIVALLLPETPAAVGLHAYGATVDSIAPPAKGANPITIAFNVLGTASKSGGFWLLFTVGWSLHHRRAARAAHRSRHRA
jgi:hypothetical protein